LSVRKTLIPLLLFGAVVASVSGQQDSAPGVPVSVLITAEPRHGKTVPPLEPQDILVREGKDKRPVQSLTPVGQQNSPMQLLLLIDDSARGTFDTEIGTLKQFVNSLPASTEIAIGYMRNGMTQFTHEFTSDHKAAADSIRMAFGAGGADVSPYDSLSDAVKRWPAKSTARKEVIMISSGIEALGGGYTSDNPYVNKGIADAQRAGVVVFTIYSPSVGHYGHSFWRTNWGQNFLSQLSDETGGESYMIGFGAPVSFQPFLQQIVERFRNQYLLTFEARPEKKPGLQAINVSVIEKDASIAAPDKVFVRAGT
jgi:VWFA-related protein